MENLQPEQQPAGEPALQTSSTESEWKPETLPAGEPAPQKPSTESEWKRFLLDLVETVGLALILFVVINSVSARVRVDGSSMLPTLHDGEFVLVDKMSYRLGQPARGDIIVFHSTTESGLDLIKRIVGLPGDRITVRGGHVSVNGQKLNETYINEPPAYAGEWRVPAGNLFVLGDNRNDSSDSHMWGFLPEGNVIGKALLIYWPPPKWAMIDHVSMAAAAP